MTIHEVLFIAQDLAEHAIPFSPRVFRPRGIKLCVGCDDLEEHHIKVPRVHAHVFDFPWVICVVEDIELLSDEHKLGILLHEIGHLYGGFDDAEADLWVHETLGIDISYVDTMQWVDVGSIL